VSDHHERSWYMYEYEALEVGYHRYSNRMRCQSDQYCSALQDSPDLNTLPRDHKADLLLKNAKLRDSQNTCKIYVYAVIASTF